MLDCTLNEIIVEKPELKKILGNSSHPFVRKYQQINEDDGQN